MVAMIKGRILLRKIWCFWNMLKPYPQCKECQTILDPNAGLVDKEMRDLQTTLNHFRIQDSYGLPRKVDIFFPLPALEKGEVLVPTANIYI